MNRHARRAARSQGTDRVLTSKCNLCGAVIAQVPMGLPLAERARQVQRAFALHCRTSGCVKAEDIEPVELPE